MLMCAGPLGVCAHIRRGLGSRILCVLESFFMHVTQQWPASCVAKFVVRRTTTHSLLQSYQQLLLLIWA
jgi:hypothetical protein